MVMTLGHMVGALLFSHIGYLWGLHYPFIISGAILLMDAVFAAFVIGGVVPSGALSRDRLPIVPRI
jgi:hypothetical protein